MKRGPGRPVLFNAKQRQSIAGLYRKHGPIDTQAILAGEEEGRNENLFPEAVVVSLPTLLKYAREFGVPELKRGRRKTGQTKAQPRVKPVAKKPAKKRVRKAKVAAVAPAAPAEELKPAA